MHFIAGDSTVASTVSPIDIRYRTARYRRGIVHDCSRPLRCTTVDIIYRAAGNSDAIPLSVCCSTNVTGIVHIGNRRAIGVRNMIPCVRRILLPRSRYLQDIAVRTPTFPYDLRSIGGRQSRRRSSR